MTNCPTGWPPERPVSSAPSVTRITSSRLMIVVAVVYPAWLMLAFIRSCARWRCCSVISLRGTPFLGDMLAGMNAHFVHSQVEVSASRHALSGIGKTPFCF